MIWPRSAARAVEPVDVLVVCTGNICRSPYIAGALAAAVPGLSVGGAGTAALVGEHPVPEVLAALERVGAPQAAQSRQLTRKLIRSASFVITATTAQRAEVIRLEPDAEGRTFTLKEISRLLGEHRPRGTTVEDRLADLAGHLHTAATNDPWDHDDDLDDPYGGDAAAYERMIAEVDAALAVIVPVLAGGAER